MAPPMSRASTLSSRAVMTSILSETLAPPMMATKGRFGVGDGLAEVVELFFHQQARGALAALLLDEVRDAFGRGVGAVRGAEGVVDVDVAELSELFGEGGVVGLFGGVEAEVFEQQRLAGLEVAGHLARDGADAVGREGDVFAVGEDVLEKLAEAVDDRAKAHGVDALALGAAEMRGEDDLGFAAQSVLDGGDGFADARVVGDGALFGERDVEVDANEDTLVGEIEVTDRELGHCEEDIRRTGRVRQWVRNFRKFIRGRSAGR